MPDTTAHNKPTAGLVQPGRAFCIPPAAVSRLGRTTRPAHLRAFADAVGHAAAHSVTAANLTRDRLIATANYLGLDWTWLTWRCRQLASVGTRALARPRSRLLGLEGLDAACQFVAAHHIS